MDESYIQSRISKFLAIRSLDDLVVYCDFVIKYTAENSDPPYSPSFIPKNAFNFYLYGKGEKYITYLIPKKTVGEFREIQAPKDSLKIIQKILNETIQLLFTPKEAAHGFIQERNIVSNAKKHVGRRFVFNIDLEDFFPTIHFGWVKAIFKIGPFYFPENTAHILANLCCHNSKLPQGAPTSPVITNLICRRLDNKMSRLAKKHRARYTRYADDITFSCNANIFTEDFYGIIEKIVEDEGFKINSKKRRLRSLHERQMVTGLIVNKKLNVTQKYKRHLKLLIKVRKDLGQEAAQEWFKKTYDKKHRYGGAVPELEEVIRGKLAFLKMVVGPDRSSYKTMQKRFYNAINERTIDPNELRNKKQEVGRLFRDIDTEGSFHSKAEHLLNIKRILSYLNNQIKKDQELDNLWQKFREETDRQSTSNPYLIFYYTKSSAPVIDPDHGLDENLVYRKIDDPSKIDKPHHPSRTSNFLELFRQPHRSSLGKTVHKNEDLGADLLLEVQQELSNRTKNNPIPIEIYIATKRFLNKLMNQVEKKGLGNKPYSEIFAYVEETIISFNRLYRFGTSPQDEQSLENFVLYKLLSNKEAFKNYWYINLDKKVNTQFSFSTSTRNVIASIHLIMEIFSKHSNGIGALEFELESNKDVIILRIIDIDSTPNKPPEYLQKGGGDIKRLKLILLSYCHLNIIATFEENQHVKIPLLPRNASVTSSSPYKPKGFTFELVFPLPKPLKVFLLDDGENGQRIQKLEDILAKHPKYNLLIIGDTIFDEARKIENYSALFVHANYKGNYGKVKYECDQLGIPIIIFSGGKSYYKVSNRELIMSDEDFYRKLPSFLEEISSKNQVTLDVFFENEDSFQNFKSENDSVEKILRDIMDQNLSFPELNEQTLARIKGLIGEKELPQFTSRKNLSRFLKSRNTQKI